MSEIEQEKKILHRAAELVERGWCQDSLGVKRVGFLGVSRMPVSSAALAQADEVCAIGALNLAIHEITGVDMVNPEFLNSLTPLVIANPPFEAIRAPILHKIQALLPPLNNGRTNFLAPWNDAKGRKAEEVAALFRQAAE